MLRYLIIPFLLVLVISGKALSVASTPKSKVLVILPLSGSLSPIGASVKNGIELALEKVRSVEVFFEDDSGVPKNTVSALQKYLSTNRPHVVITASSGTSKAIAPILEKEKLPLIAIATDEEISRDRSYAVNFWVTPDTQAKLLVNEASRRGYKKIAIFSTVHEGTMSIKRKFTDYNNGVLQVVYDEEFSDDIKDFRTLITRFKKTLKTEEVDGIFLNVFFGQVGLFAKQLRQLGITHPLFSIELFEDENEVKNSNGALLNQWYVQADDAGQEFLKTYYGKYPDGTSFGAANGHDAVLLINDANNRGAYTSSEINEYLHNVENFEGALGVFSSSGDNRFNLPAVIKIVTDKGFSKLSD
ncbi:MAG TPA: ABC transporter substrate-binding protein [Oligoflexia bacterium]|mgnify:CR=1 FL=1|nr:ABC transporter substrate-binding protein [Oligoflexia bacterium]HMP48054.1 ABC transporter substrate-binding protein [Oligoflexia bacterium]